jgi:hypothetical protein
MIRQDFPAHRFGLSFPLNAEGVPAKCRTLVRPAITNEIKDIMSMEYTCPYFCAPKLRP